jgi:hypothetical protein
MSSSSCDLFNFWIFHLSNLLVGTWVPAVCDVHMRARAQTSNTTTRAPTQANRARKSKRLRNPCTFPDTPNGNPAAEQAEMEALAEAALAEEAVCSSPLAPSALSSPRPISFQRACTLILLPFDLAHTWIEPAHGALPTIIPGPASVSCMCAARQVLQHLGRRLTRGLKVGIR